MSEIDVVVVTYNSAEHVRACVEPLARTAEMNVIVVDSASEDDSLGQVSDLPVATVQLSANRGFGHACNVGWRRGRAPAVLFLNPDARADAATVRRLAAAVAVDGRVGVAGPKILESDGTLDYSIREFPSLGSTYAQALFVHRLLPHARWTDEVIREEAAYAEPRSAPWLSGACLLVRRDLLERLDGFDEGFFLYCEDLDLCRRIHDLGCDIRFEPEAVVVHEGGASTPRPALLPVLAASRIRYARKHRSSAAAAAERLGVALGALTHAVAGRAGTAARRPEAQDVTGSG
jgi:N-acetylglucosaminyl-diphospho-decaprenol L-rhamnosyltransferase